MMKTLHVNTHPGYDVIIKNDLLSGNDITKFCQSIGKRIVIITDTAVAELYGETLLKQLQHADIITFPAGEAYKTRGTKQELEDVMLEQGCGRDTLVVALGGGVVTDMAGFIAATYCRGIPTIYIPTTLLSMVDAAIGGKTGVNTPFGKNLIGNFKQPTAVFIDPVVLKTLTDDCFNDGLVETVKHSLIYDASLLEKLNPLPSKDHEKLTDIIYQSCDIKRQVIEQDTHEQGIRQILNFGHTVAHALETLTEYHISHGHAVLLGMQVETELSHLAGHLSVEDNQSIQQFLSQIQYANKVDFDKNQFPTIIELMQLDKKAVDQQAHFVLLKNIGEVYQTDGHYSHAVAADLLLQALSQHLI